MIKRDLYLNQIFEFIDKPFIKILSGLRRSGKSSILTLIKEELLKRGVQDSHIVFVNFESFDFIAINNAVYLQKYIKDKIKDNKKYYILLDEIQEVENWEKAVNSFMVDFNCDIIITGSNSRLLSSELATYLAGRYIEFHIYTLSFSEYLQFKSLNPTSDLEIYNAFDEYIKRGGFPALHVAEYSIEASYKAVYDIYSSAILRDTVQRYGIRDVELLERVVKYVFDNIGNSFSAKNVADYFKSQQRRIDLNTVYNYLSALVGSFIISRIPRYDVKGKEILKTQEKYFVGDPALIYSVMGFKERLISGILENIVMHELTRRGYNVYVGKIGDLEIDFIAEKKGEKIYVQVSYLLSEESTVEREFSPLLKIKDNYPKFVVSMDRFRKDDIEGIKHRNIADFLLSNF